MVFKFSLGHNYRGWLFMIGAGVFIYVVTGAGGFVEFRAVGLGHNFRGWCLWAFLQWLVVFDITTGAGGSEHNHMCWGFLHNVGGGAGVFVEFSSGKLSRT